MCKSKAKSLRQKNINQEKLPYIIVARHLKIDSNRVFMYDIPI